MSADQTEVVRQHVTIQFFTKLGANSAAAYTAGQSTKNGARNGTDRETHRAEKGADSCAYLATCECATRSSCSAADSTNSGTDRHG